jgi:hypothetical protein
MRKKLTATFFAVVVLFSLLPFVPVAAAEDESTDEGLTNIPNSPDDYGDLQTNLKKDSLADALRRIRALEQDNRFQTKRIELLERNVDDLKNDNSRRSRI